VSAQATFAYLASLFGPVDDGAEAQVITLPEDWSLPDATRVSADIVIVGRMPVRGRPTVRMVGHACRREVLLLRLRLRPFAGRRIVSIERLPPVHRPGRLRRLIRSVTMSGLLIELAREPIRPRVIDAISAEAGGRRTPRLRPSGDGSAVATLELTDGRRVQLRVVPAGHPDDPSRGRAALVTLEAARVPCVPRPVAHGLVRGADWTTETFITGHHVQRLTDPLVRDVIETCARFPTGAMERDALADHAATLVRMRPRDSAAIERIHDAARRWAGPTRVLLHGDLWLQNLLVADGRLVGIIDWEMWHPSGLPGLDVLSLLAAEQRTVSGQDTGDLLVDGYWRSPQVRAALDRYFEAIGQPGPGPERLAAIAIGWWLSRMAFADGRIDQRARDPAWARRNIEAPLRTIERLTVELG
jgi:aminoglycoside phosphotransferase (APT) family kinase protein